MVGCTTDAAVVNHSCINTASLIRCDDEMVVIEMSSRACDGFLI
jgi:hypothetical protein